MDRPDVAPSTRRCSCGESYETPVISGRPVLPYCPACTDRVNSGPDTVTRSDTDTMLVALEALGLNVHRHGHLTRGPHAGEVATLDNLGDGPGVRAARKWVGDIVGAPRWRAVDPLYLHGPTGTGKSQVAFCAVRALLEAGVPKGDIVYDRGRSLITQLQDRYGTGTVDAFGAVRRGARVWVYEDAGTEKLTPDAFRVVEDIFDAREGRPGLATSNYSREVMAQRWNEVDGWVRLRSRLGAWRSVEMSGADLRFQERGVAA